MVAPPRHVTHGLAWTTNSATNPRPRVSLSTPWVSLPAPSSARTYSFRARIRVPAAVDASSNRNGSRTDGRSIARASRPRLSACTRSRTARRAPATMALSRVPAAAPARRWRAGPGPRAAPRARPRRRAE